jgi:sulfite exporter TauE/SafE
MDFGIAIVLGLLGSLHCAAMCGPLMLALWDYALDKLFIFGRIGA